MKTDELYYLLALNFVKGVDPKTARSLLEMASGESLFTGNTLSDLPVSASLKRLFSVPAREEALRLAEAEVQFIRKNKISVLSYSDCEYPFRLKECEDAPLLLFFKGNTDLNRLRVVSIVGTRHATVYGRDFCQTFVRELSHSISDLLVISGLAYGIDIAAHRAALESGVSTVGVLAHGLQTLYPDVHRSAAVAMLEKGGLITEYTSQQKIYKGNFIARNRIVAGMADATVVVESAEKGGALITADLAGGYHRDVFALPGRVGDPYSQGCNRLIASNRAALIESALGFISQMCWEVPAREPVWQASLFPALELEEEEHRVLKALDETGECQVNQLALVVGLPASRLLSLLLELEFKNLVSACPGGMYRRKGR